MLLTARELIDATALIARAGRADLLCQSIAVLLRVAAQLQQEITSQRTTRRETFP